jgi:sec-independent protein translocase protein TatC
MAMSMKQKPIKNHRRTTTPKHSVATMSTTQPFSEHLKELRRRIVYIAASVFVWAAAAYAIQQKIVHLLLRPSHGQQFIYTTPGGGIDFLFRICIYAGIVFSLPVIVYNVLRYIEPVIGHDSRKSALWGSAVSGFLAVAGVCFGYIIGLPAALHFLLHQFTTAQIKPLVTIQSYLAFVIVYMVGSALLFQLPLLLLFINRLKPLSPSGLWKYERWVILAAFVIAGLMNPSPNIFSQLLVAGPFILMYQVGIGMIALTNRKRKQQAPIQETAMPQPIIEAELPPALAILPSNVIPSVAVRPRSLDGFIAAKAQPFKTTIPAPQQPATPATMDARNYVRRQTYYLRRGGTSMDGMKPMQFSRAVS